MKVYLAGPLFTPYEREFIDRCAAQLRAAGFDVFVPHEHELALDGTVTAERIFAKDWEGLHAAEAVLAILDGPMVDDGTACEIGIFYGLMRADETKKGIVGLVTDLRALRGTGREAETRGLNLFVVGCIEAAGSICTTLDDAQAVLDGWRARGNWARVRAVDSPSRSRPRDCPYDGGVLSAGHGTPPTPQSLGEWPSTITHVCSRRPSVVASHRASVSPAINFRLVSSLIRKSNSFTSISGIVRSFLAWLPRPRPPVRLAGRGSRSRRRGAAGRRRT